MRLVDHERDVLGAAAGDLAHDAEQLERVDRADDQVVVRVLAVVEVEAAEQSFREQHRHDLLDVRPLRMVAGVDEHLRLRAEPPAQHRGRSPVGKVGAVEARLEELVLDEQPHPGGEQRVQLFEPGGETRMPFAQIVLAGVVRPVGEPEADDRGAELLRDLDALAAVVERLRAHARVGVTDAPEPVRVVAEQVRIDRADPDALLLRVTAERLPVVDAVPRDVQRDGRAAAGEPVHERGVVDPLPDGTGGARPGIDVEAGAGVPVAPRRRLDLETRRAGRALRSPSSPRV